MILVIDNYDSFTFNLVQALQAAGADVRVVRNDAIDRAGIDALAADPATGLRGIVISPGPGNPGTAGVSVDAIRVAAEHRVPLLGVCLGMQSMAAAFGASIVRAPTLVHGEASEVRHDGEGLLEGMPRAVLGGALPLALRRRRDAAGGAAGHRDERRRRRRDGPAPHVAAAGGRPVPPRVGAHARRAAPARELPAPGRGRGVGAPRRPDRVVRDPRPRRRGAPSTPRRPAPSGSAR